MWPCRTMAGRSTFPPIFANRPPPPVERAGWRRRSAQRADIWRRHRMEPGARGRRFRTRVSGVRLQPREHTPWCDWRRKFKPLRRARLPDFPADSLIKPQAVLASRPRTASKFTASSFFRRRTADAPSCTGLLSRRIAPPDAARISLHVLLLERLFAESISREPRLCRAVA